MKPYIALILFVSLAHTVAAQATLTEMKFHEGSALYIKGENEQALRAVKDGLRLDPADEKLLALKKLLEKEQKKDQEKKQQQEEQKRQQQQKEKEQQKQDQQKKEEQEKKDQEKKDAEQKKDEQKDGKKPEEQKQNPKKPEDENKDPKDEDKKDPASPEQEPEFKNLTKEQAQMLLEAMRNQEIQYLQQKRRTTKSRKKKGPDW